MTPKELLKRFKRGERWALDSEPMKSAADNHVKSADHNYRTYSGCMICSECGATKHNKIYQGFKYWHAGKGYAQEPPCKKHSV